MFKPTQVTCSKASRLPLTSKKANRDFYKGTRTGNIMRRKRIATADSRGTQLYDKGGRERYWHLKTARIDEARIPNYVVPPGLAETKLSPPSSLTGVFDPSRMVEKLGLMQKDSFASSKHSFHDLSSDKVLGSPSTHALLS
ncbi:uncharacterized protein UBRO2_03066 [Ustilago bromivora]|uniref:Uncharacterized protein n=1 Tax=Ustilago bromivora TaxID=307758 RepID=A0A8H8QM37_9BASI|nr:uncharacterized protein UBRO2_03066 [Ustilago bromivora]